MKTDSAPWTDAYPAWFFAREAASKTDRELVEGLFELESKLRLWAAGKHAHGLLVHRHGMVDNSRWARELAAQLKADPPVGEVRVAASQAVSCLAKALDEGLWIAEWDRPGYDDVTDSWRELLSLDLDIDPRAVDMVIEPIGAWRNPHDEGSTEEGTAFPKQSPEKQEHWERGRAERAAEKRMQRGLGLFSAILAVTLLAVMGWATDLKWLAEQESNPVSKEAKSPEAYQVDALKALSTLQSVVDASGARAEVARAVEACEAGHYDEALVALEAAKLASPSTDEAVFTGATVSLTLASLNAFLPAEPQ